MIEQIRLDGARIVAAAQTAGLDAALPTAPEWVMRDLLRHLGGVHRWAMAHVRDTAPEIIDVELETLVGGWPSDIALLAWFTAGYVALTDVLESADPDVQCATFLVNDSPLQFWTRRQAHETAIHRVDAQAAVGEIDGFPAAFAADGIDELLVAFITRPFAKLRADVPCALGVACDDVDAAWTVNISQEPVVTERTLRAADCVVRGNASDVYQAVWNRGDAVRADGEASVWKRFRDLVRVSW